MNVTPREFDDTDWEEIENWMAYKAGEQQGRQERIRKILGKVKAKSAEQYIAYRVDQLIGLIIELGRK
jgi:hypothetical protein